MDREPTNNLSRCKRCGTCCRKGGPGLHIEDKDLVDSGKIPLTHLLTMRQGEPAFDNVNDSIAPAVTDIIKIKGTHESTPLCIFYEAPSKGCRIYNHRPAECRALQCWDTQAIQNIYKCRRLTRRHLLANVKGVWELVQDHQEHCDYGLVAELAAAITKQGQQGIEAQQELLEMIRYDRHLRQVTLERTGVASEMLTFLFGRKLSFTIGLFQLKIIPTEQGPTFVPGGDVCYRRNGF